MKPFQTLVGLGLLVLVLASPMPWLTITFFRAPSSEQFNLILFDIYNIILRGPKAFPSTDTGSFLGAAIEIISRAKIMIFPAFLYFISIVLGMISVAYRRMSLLAGATSILTGFAWVLGVDLLKSTLILEANKEGGIFEPITAKGISSIITVGYGVYVVILVGVIFFLAFFFEGQVSRSSQLTASLREIRSELKSVSERNSRLNAVIQSLEERDLKLMKDLSELRREHDGVVSIMLRCRVENSYTVGDRLYASIRNIGSLPITWIEITDINPRPKGANLPSGQIQLLGGISPGSAIKFTYDLRDIYNKPLMFDPTQTYNIQMTAGWGQAQQVFDFSFKLVGGSQFRAEIEGEYTTGNSLVMNIKNVGFYKITQERVTSISPSPGGPAPPAQKVIINPGETKTLWFTWTEGAFIQGVSYAVGIELSDGTNVQTLPIIVVAS
ncbi:MAG: hypothetical protein ACUVQ8_04105 [Nitrososphaeria archaeon]